jgi:hypothetical protein
MPAGNTPGKPLKKHAYAAFFNKLAADMGMALPSESSVQPVNISTENRSVFSPRATKLPGLTQYTSFRNPGGTQTTARNIGI